MKKLGRPSKIKPKLTKAICDRLAAGESVRSICLDPQMPNRKTVQDWLTNEGEPYETFYHQYCKAVNVRAENMFDELLDIADDQSSDTTLSQREGKEICNKEFVLRSKLRVDTRKWYLARVMPKKYGEALKLSGDGESPLQVETTLNAKQAEQLAILIAQRTSATPPEEHSG